jgi:2-iminobutanoate/2-iminopropanoate deaminase
MRSNSRVLIFFLEFLLISPGVLVDKTLYVAGQIGWNVKGELAEGIENQTKLALDNMGHVLEAAGATHKNGLSRKV